MLGCPHNQDACYGLDVCHWPEPDWAGFALPVCTENLNPGIAVMESSQNGKRCDAPGPLDRARDRRIFIQ
jgi:hypothetical protein